MLTTDRTGRHCLLLLVGLALLAAPSSGATGSVESFDSARVMGTLLEISVTAADADAGRRLLDAAFIEARRLEDAMTNWRPDSELSAFNRAAGRGPQPVSVDLLAVLDLCRRLHGETGGAFDATLGPSILLRRREKAPDRLSLAVARSRTGCRWLRVSPRGASLARPGMAIDLGGIGKGYAVDRMVALMREGGAESGFIDFGHSTMAAFGPRDYRAALRALDGRLRGVVALRDAALGTSESGPSEAGILDPATGRAITARRLATVRGRSAALSDGWSTALIVRGRAGLAQLRAVSAGLEAWYEDEAGATTARR